MTRAEPRPPSSRMTRSLPQNEVNGALEGARPHGHVEASGSDQAMAPHFKESLPGQTRGTLHYHRELVRIARPHSPTRLVFPHKV